MALDPMGAQDLSSRYDAATLTPGVPSLASGAAGHGTAKLHKTAVEFESVLLGQWLASAEKSFASVPGSEEDEDPGGEQMMSFGVQQLAGSIAASGGLGLAKMVERGLEAAAAREDRAAGSDPGQSASEAKQPGTL